MSLQRAAAADLTYQVGLKNPGNQAVTYPLKSKGGQLVADVALPLSITEKCVPVEGGSLLTLTIAAQETVYFNIGAMAATDFKTDQCEFYLPGFWYHKNLRSPREAPSFHTSNSWNFREDRLSAPLTGVYDTQTGKGISVMRKLDGPQNDALLTHQEGEVILGGECSLGYLGFDNADGRASLTFGYPFVESPKRYIRKLTRDQRG